MPFHVVARTNIKNGMKNATAQPIIRNLLSHIKNKKSWTTEAMLVPTRNYTSRDHLRREQESVFALMPQLVALSSDLPELGSTLTRDTASLPLLLTRDHAGQVHAFANVCAHRGAQVISNGRDCARRLICPYHAWSYDLQGTLVSAPDQKAFPDITVPGPGLRELAVYEGHGTIWVTLDLDTIEPVDPQLGAITEDLDSFGIKDYNYWRSHHFDLDMNWKLVIDTFLEPYHFASLHRNTVGPLFVANLCHAERFGHHVREVLPRQTLVDLVDAPPNAWALEPHSALVYVLFPNTVFVMQIDHIETWRVSPDPHDPHKSKCDLDFYIPKLPETSSESSHWERNWQLTIDTVIDEDFATMTRVQRGLSSNVASVIRIGSNEPALGMFHASLHEAIEG